jgi:hypothetical protein
MKRILILAAVALSLAVSGTGATQDAGTGTEVVDAAVKGADADKGPDKGAKKAVKKEAAQTSDEEVQLSGEELEKLKSLGYVE